MQLEKPMNSFKVSHTLGVYCLC